VTHEFGHALGLGHVADLNSPMHGTLATGTVNRAMTVQDLNIPDPPAGADALTAAPPAAAVAVVTPVVVATPAAPAQGLPAGVAAGDAGGADLAASLAVPAGHAALTAYAARARLTEAGAAQPFATSFAGRTAPVLSAAADRYLPGGGGEPDGSYDEADDVWFEPDTAATANFLPSTSGPVGTRAETAAVARQGGETVRDDSAGGLPAGRADVRVLDAYFAGPAVADVLPAVAPVLPCPATAPDEFPANSDRSGRPGAAVALAGFFAGVFGRVGAGSRGRRNRRDGDPNGRDVR
jgi:hypothetical protein